MMTFSMNRFRRSPWIISVTLASLALSGCGVSQLNTLVVGDAVARAPVDAAPRFDVWIDGLGQRGTR